MIGDGCEHLSIAWPGMVSVSPHCRQINDAATRDEDHIPLRSLVLT